MKGEGERERKARGKGRQGGRGGGRSRRRGRGREITRGQGEKGEGKEEDEGVRGKERGIDGKAGSREGKEGATSRGVFARTKISDLVLWRREGRAPCPPPPLTPSRLPSSPAPYAPPYITLAWYFPKFPAFWSGLQNALRNRGLCAPPPLLARVLLDSLSFLLTLYHRRHHGK